MAEPKEEYGQWDVYLNGEFKVSIPYCTKLQAIDRYIDNYRCLLSDKLRVVPSTRGIIVSCWCEGYCKGHGDE